MRIIVPRGKVAKVRRLIPADSVDIQEADDGLYLYRVVLNQEEFGRLLNTRAIHKLAEGRPLGKSADRPK